MTKGTTISKNDTIPEGTLVKMSVDEKGHLLMYVKYNECPALFGIVRKQCEDGSLLIEWHTGKKSRVRKNMLRYLTTYKTISEEMEAKLKELFPAGATVRLLYDGYEGVQNYTDYDSFRPVYGTVLRVNLDGSIDVCWDTNIEENIPFISPIKIQVCDRANPLENEMLAYIIYLSKKAEQLAGPDLKIENTAYEKVKELAALYPVHGYKITIFSETLAEPPVLLQHIIETKKELIQFWNQISELYGTHYYTITDNLFENAYGNVLCSGLIKKNLHKYFLEESFEE